MNCKKGTAVLKCDQMHVLIIYKLYKTYIQKNAIDYEVGGSLTTLALYTEDAHPTF